MSYAYCDRCPSYSDETTEVGGILLCPECLAAATCEQCDKPHLTTQMYENMGGGDVALCFNCYARLSMEAEANMESQYDDRTGQDA